MSTTFPIAELGHYALIVALALSLVQSVFPLWGAKTNDSRLMELAPFTAIVAFVYVTFAFAALMTAYVTSDFSVRNVWENSFSTKPLLYKIGGVWGNHEGSMLLWVLIVTLFAALIALFGRALPKSLFATVLAVQGWIAAAFLAFILMTSNPFARLMPAPVEGRDLNPILQDVGLAIHPPFLYLGYVGFSVTFAFAVAALIDGRIDSAWARWVRPWTLAAWIFLTIGIAFGSYWAYYELGWGGWWFWDPVENASFMPWLAGTALLHSAIVMEKRAALKIWTVLLAILTFSLSLLGAFLVRSGVLTSVHAFASDPTRGLFILAILVAFIGGSLALFASRAPVLRQGGLFAPISREGALVFNNLFMVAATATVLVGTLYPLGLEAFTGNKISVGSPYYNLTFVPLMIPLLLAMPFGPMLAWKRGDLAGVAQRLAVALVAAILAVFVTLLVTGTGSLLAPFGVALGVWLVAGAIVEITDRIKLLRTDFATSWSRLKGLPRAAFGTMLGHAGIGVTVIGIAMVTGYSAETITELKPGESATVSGYELRYVGAVPRTGPNYRENIARFTVSGPGIAPLAMQSSKRFYDARKTSTTEAAIKTLWFSQIYLSIGEWSDDGALVVRAYYKSMVTLVWLGPLLMVFGGLLSLADRRLRIGIATRARKRPPQAAPEPAA